MRRKGGFFFFFGFVFFGFGQNFDYLIFFERINSKEKPLLSLLFLLDDDRFSCLSIPNDNEEHVFFFFSTGVTDDDDDDDVGNIVKVLLLFCLP